MAKTAASIIQITGTSGTSYCMNRHNAIDLTEEACHQGIEDALDALICQTIGDFTDDPFSLRFLVIGEEPLFADARVARARVKKMVAFALAERGLPITLTDVSFAPYTAAERPRQAFPTALTATLVVEVMLAGGLSSELAFVLVDNAMQSLSSYCRWVMDGCIMTREDDGDLRLEYWANIDRPYDQLGSLDDAMHCDVSSQLSIKDLAPSVLIHIYTL